MPAVDSSNIIKGNRDKETDLYDQLELTRSFNVEEIEKAAKVTRKTNQKRRKAYKKTKETSKKSKKWC